MFVHDGEEAGRAPQLGVGLGGGEDLDAKVRDLPAPDGVECD